MGNFAGKLSGHRIGGSSILVDQLLSSGELMVRFSQPSIDRIMKEPECILLLSMITELLMELDIKDSSKTKSSRLGPQSSMPLRDFDTFVPRVSAEKLTVRAHEASMNNPQIDGKVLAQV